ncbi:MAG: UbiA-like polyprenyltransferase [Phycisphaerales bacterium JB065]
MSATSHPPAADSPSVPPLAARVRLALADIKLAHSVFALPFAILAAVMVIDRVEGGERWLLLGLIVFCMVAARTWAMLVNRLADHRLDAANPRTARRAIASGALRVKDGWAMALLSAALFLAGCAGFWFVSGNPVPLVLGVPVLGWIALYSYTKRFTALCHLFLGTALAISPVCAVLAISPQTMGLMGGELEATGWSVILLSAFVALWVAGFDVAYALQDFEYDRSVGLHSVPSALGVRGSLWVSRILHALGYAALVGAWVIEPRFGVVFGVAVFGVAGLLVFEHLVLARRGIAGLPLAFFTLNGVVSVVLGLAGIANIVLALFAVA